jgi:hypothetical protein
MNMKWKQSLSEWLQDVEMAYAKLSEPAPMFSWTSMEALFSI